MFYDTPSYVKYLLSMGFEIVDRVALVFFALLEMSFSGVVAMTY